MNGLMLRSLFGAGLGLVSLAGLSAAVVACGQSSSGSSWEDEYGTTAVKKMVFYNSGAEAIDNRTDRGVIYTSLAARGFWLVDLYFAFTTYRTALVDSIPDKFAKLTYQEYNSLGIELVYDKELLYENGLEIYFDDYTNTSWAGYYSTLPAACYTYNQNTLFGSVACAFAQEQRSYSTVRTSVRIMFDGTSMPEKFTNPFSFSVSAKSSLIPSIPSNTFTVQVRKLPTYP